MKCLFLSPTVNIYKDIKRRGYAPSCVKLLKLLNLVILVNILEFIKPTELIETSEHITKVKNGEASDGETNKPQAW